MTGKNSMVNLVISGSSWVYCKAKMMGIFSSLQVSHRIQCKQCVCSASVQLENMLEIVYIILCKAKMFLILFSRNVHRFSENLGHVSGIKLIEKQCNFSHLTLVASSNYVVKLQSCVLPVFSPFLLELD